MSTLQNVILWMRGAWRSRTMWAAGALALTGAAVQLGRLTLPPAYTGWTMIGLAVVIGALRSVTSTSLAAKIPGTPSAGPPPAASK